MQSAARTHDPADARARYARYAMALQRASKPEERQRILKVLAAICREDLDDLPRAVELSQRILRDHPKDLDALMGLLSAYERLGNAEALFAEIEHALFLFEGEQCLEVLVRKASALSKFGDREQSSELRAKLLEQPNLSPSIAESILAGAYEDDQFDVYRNALELLVQSRDAAVRRRALERLGDFHFEQRGDRPSAIESWKPAARLYVEESSEENHGRELYERVLEVEPNDDESALELVALYARNDDWARMPEVYGALLRSGAGIEVAISTLLEVEGAATRAGAVDEYVSMVDETIPLLSIRDDDSHCRLIRAKVRLLGSDPRRESEASTAHRQVLELFGGAEDVEAYAAFIESRSSFDDRLADLRWLFEFRASRPVDAHSVGSLASLDQRIAAVLVDGLGGDRTVPETTRAAWYERLFALHANESDSAFELATRAVRDLPDTRPFWETLARLSRPGARAGRAAEAYRAAIQNGMAPGIADEIGRLVIGLLDESAANGEEILGTLMAILGRAPGARWALDRATLALSARERWDELLGLYENAIENARGDGERAELLNEAAVAARDLARQPERAITYFEALLELRPSETSVEGALERLYERGGKTHELVRLLSARVERVTGTAHLELLHRLAAGELDLGHVDRAAEAVERILEYGGASLVELKDILERMLRAGAPALAERAASLLSAHYTASGLTHDLIRVTKTRLSLSKDPTVRARSVRDLVRARLETADDASAPFSSARVALKEDLAGDPELSEAAGLALLDEASREWDRQGAAPDSDAARTARETLLELAAHYDLQGRPERALSVLSSGLKLPFAIADRRGLRARIASTLANRLNEPERAARTFDELFAEDAGDAVAESCLDQFVSLLAAAGRKREEAELWERIGHRRELAGSGARAAEAWTRAAAHWEGLDDPTRAVAAYSAAAALGSDVAIAALGRLHSAHARWFDAAQALEWLIPRVKSEEQLEYGLTLTDYYSKAGQAETAGRRLSELVSVATLRERLSGRGDGRSKHDALLHRAIARVLLHQGRPSEALVELETAARLNPTEPGTLHALARVAFDEGNLDVAQATLRSLVLALHHGTPPGCECPSRAEVYLDLSLIAELRGDPVAARDLAESAFDSALESPEDTARLERILEDRGRHTLLALAIERRLRRATDAEAIAQGLDTLVTLWEGPLAQRADTAAVVARYAELLAREAEAARNVVPGIWAAHIRASAAVGGEAARVEAVTRYIGRLSRAAEALAGDEAFGVLLETARQYDSGLGQTERAIGIAEALFEMAPTRADVWSFLRDLHRHLGTAERLVALAESVLGGARSSEVHKQARLDLARTLIENPAKVELAIATLKGILAEDPSDAATRDALVDALEREGRHAELVEVLSAGLGFVTPPRRRATSMRLGRALERASRTAEAAIVYVRLAKDDDASVEELRVVATRLHALGSEYLPDCLELLLGRETGAAAVELSRRLVELCATKQDRAGVVRALSAGFALKPDDAQFRDGLLSAFEEERRWDEAIRVLQRALASEPSNRALLQRLVDAHQRAGNFDGALEVLGQALRRHPSDAELLRQRGWLCEACGRLDDAIADLAKAYTVDRSLADDLVALLAKAGPGDGGQRSVELVDLLIALDRLSDARSVVEMLLAQTPKHVGGLERLASLTAAEGDAALALELYREIVPLEEVDPPTMVRVSLAIAALCDEQGSLADATDALERAYRLVPTHAELRGRLARAYEIAGASARLADFLEAEARRTTAPAEAASLLLRAAECVLDAAPARALELSEASRAVDPEGADGLVIRSRCLARLGRLDDAETTLRQLPKVPRGRAAELVSSAYLELARLYLTRDDLVEAFDCLKRAYTANPKNDDASLLLGLVAIDLDDELFALRALRAATASRSALAPESKAIARHQLARLGPGASGAKRAG